MKKLKFILPFLLVAASLAGYLSCSKKEYKNLDCSAHPHAFAANIKPVVDASCALSGCHASGSSNGDFSTYSGIKAAVNAGTFGDAALYKQNMPPSGPLPKEDRDRIKCWIDGGAPDN